MDCEKERRAIEYLRAFEPMCGSYYLCYSGGKDSDCIRILAQLAGVQHDIVHNLTTVDAPETIQYIKSIPGVIIDRPLITMWQLIVKQRIPPTRLRRYCCAVFKERSIKGRLKVTGVRRAESAARYHNSGVITVTGNPKTTRKEVDRRNLDYAETPRGGIVMNDDNAETRRFVECCYRTTTMMINPIVDWTDADVWEFLRHYGCKSNPLYQDGFARVGCIGCPLAGAKQQKKQFARWPKYRAAYVRAFDKMLDARKDAGLRVDDNWTDGEAVMRWWLGDDPEQMALEDIL